MKIISKIKHLDLLADNRSIIDHYLKCGESKGISEDMKEYIDQLNAAMEVYDQSEGMVEAAKKLQERYKDEGMSYSTARRRLEDAINYFHLRSKVKNEAWDSFYADKLEKLAQKAELDSAWDVVRLCLIRAHELRTKRDENAINPEDLKIKNQLISPDMSPERLGLKERNLRKMWLDTNTFLEELDLETVHKERILKEAAEVLDVDYEEISGN